MIVERGVFGENILFARPLRVISHDDVLALSLPIGTRYFGPQFDNRESAYTDFFQGKVGFGEKTWEQHHVLVLVRPDDAYQILGFWNERLEFVGWYVNLQEPARFHSFGYDTQDHALDIIVGEDLKSWMWKDEDELALSVEKGLYTPEQGREIRQAGEDVIKLIESGEVWWGRWRAWEPEPDAGAPAFPQGWDERV